MSEVVKDWVLKENSVKTLVNGSDEACSSVWFTVDGKDPKQPVGRLVVGLSHYLQGWK